MKQQEWSQEEWQEWVDHPISRAIRQQLRNHLDQLGRESLSGNLLKASDATHEHLGILVGRAAMCRDIIELMSEGENAE